MANKSIHLNQEEIEIIATHSICRLCASQNEKLMGIFSEEGIGNDLSNKINLYLPIKVSPADDLPLQCCWNCASTLLAWHELVVTCVEIDKKFRSAQFIPAPVKGPAEGGGFDNTENIVSDDNNDDCDNDGLPEESTTKPGFCLICQKNLSRARDLKRHITTCHPDSKITNSVTTLVKKKPKETDSLKPKRHRRKKHEILPEFFCDVCDKGFTRKYDMEKHRTRTHIGYVSQSPENKIREENLKILEKCILKDSEGKTFYQCDFCQRSFAQRYNMMRHRTIHTGVREYFCHFCGKSFRMASGLNRHIEFSHKGIKKFACEICKKMFTARATRDEHMNIHTNNRPFVCDICGKSFKQKASLHVHKMFHSDMFRFECDNCGKKFRRRQDLKVHSWMHTGHRPYSCPKCKAAFRLRHDLNRHLKIHDKLSECVCNVCGLVFTQERYLKLHKKIHNFGPGFLKDDGALQT